MKNSHTQITCPNCDTAFPIDKTNYALIAQQVRTKEFNDELEKKVQIELSHSLKILENQLTTKYKDQISDQEKSINQLKSDLKLHEEQLKNKHQTALDEKEKEIIILKNNLKTNDAATKTKVDEAIKTKEQEILQLKNDIKLSEIEAQTKINEVVLGKEKEIINLKNELKSLEDKRKISDLELKEKYIGQITLLEEEVQKIKNFKSSISKEIGEDLEKYCETQFECVRQDSYRNAIFEKDNVLVNGMKGDFIFRDFDEDGDEIVSIMFDMKNEHDESIKKRQNKSFYSDLNKNRLQKNCEYAVLVSNLEKDSEFFKRGIVEIGGEYEKLYVVQPQFFLLIISLLRNMSIKNLKDKRELQMAKKNNLNYSVLSENMDIFREGCLEKIKLASTDFKQMLNYIDAVIRKLKKLREFLESAKSNLGIANQKLGTFDIKSMTESTKRLGPSQD